MSNKIGIVAYSFGLCESEPSQIHRNLAKQVVDISERHKLLGRGTVIVAQWEIALALQELEVPIDHTVDLKQDGTYLGTEDVWLSAAETFAHENVQLVTPVAQPLLHLGKAKRLVKDHNLFELRSEKIDNPGFPKESTQWWTRSPFHLLVYALAQTAFGHQPKRQNYKPN